jgi:hypothetical protein
VTAHILERREVAMLVSTPRNIAKWGQRATARILEKCEAVMLRWTPRDIAEFVMRLFRCGEVESLWVGSCG